MSLKALNESLFRNYIKEAYEDAPLGDISAFDDYCSTNNIPNITQWNYSPEEIIRTVDYCDENDIDYTLLPDYEFEEICMNVNGYDHDDWMEDDRKQLKMYNVGKQESLKESKPMYSGWDMSDDLRPYTVTIVIGGTDGDRETGMVAPDSYYEIVNAMSEADAEHIVAKSLNKGEAVTDVHLSTKEELAEYYADNLYYNSDEVSNYHDESDYGVEESLNESADFRDIAAAEDLGKWDAESSISMKSRSEFKTYCQEEGIWYSKDQYKTYVDSYNKNKQSIEESLNESEADEPMNNIIKTARISHDKGLKEAKYAIGSALNADSEALNRIADKIQTNWREAKLDLIDYIKSVNTSDLNKKNAITKINRINNASALMSAIASFMTGESVLRVDRKNDRTSR